MPFVFTVGMLWKLREAERPNFPPSSVIRSEVEGEVVRSMRLEGSLVLDIVVASVETKESRVLNRRK
jgi:hypothetical protein